MVRELHPGRAWKTFDSEFNVVLAVTLHLNNNGRGFEVDGYYLWNIEWNSIFLC